MTAPIIEHLRRAGPEGHTVRTVARLLNLDEDEVRMILNDMCIEGMLALSVLYSGAWLIGAARVWGLV